ncbi:MAG: bifunctional UDP-N-acetylglucosamine diphosphorylase/glucosamine-1-phosphate N-acetyltransferase GlmU [Helicobacter sp.]|nr:bifunctional UDP-N-acetylglucosamine diphosphorylase/glucosamine-1-phosphate N-acetyltransferase GlmU [Helicobacter sp.]
MSVSIIILSAGKGTRMKSSTPKVLHKICGLEMILHVLEVAKKLSDDIHVILGHESEQIKNRICDFYKNNAINFHIQDLARFPGTAGALIINEKPLQTKYKKVLILNGDCPNISADELLAKLELNFGIGVFRSNELLNYGHVVIENNRALQIIEEKDCNQDQKKIDVLNAGAYIFPADVLQELLPKIKPNNAQNEYYLTDLIALASKKYEITPFFVKQDNFIGVNSKLDLAKAEALKLDKIRSKFMENGVIFHLPESIYIDYFSSIVGECQIYEGTRIEKSVISNSIIKSHSIINESNVINSEVGPFAHIRPKSQILNSKIGNFVETKAAKIIGAKANHLSYLGDCEILEGSNIGAGVITCNYDGKKKHQTKIGKNVFVGSDVQLIAPISIEDNVLIAAGSTVTKNAESGDLIISRKEQKAIKNGYFKFFK